MKKDAKKEELQSRREFFKKAAKGALPILGTIVMAQLPVLSKAVPHNTELGCYCYGCVGGCQGECLYTCRTSCYNTCNNTCTGNCRGTCYGTCQNTCNWGCYTTCYASAH